MGKAIGLTPPENEPLREKIQRFVEYVCRNLGIEPPLVEVPSPKVFQQFTEFPEVSAVYRRDLCLLPSPTQPPVCYGPAVLFNPERRVTATIMAHEIIHHKDYEYFMEKFIRYLKELPADLAILAVELEVDSRARRLVRRKGLAETWRRILKDD